MAGARALRGHLVCRPAALGQVSWGREASENAGHVGPAGSYCSPFSHGDVQAGVVTDGHDVPPVPFLPSVEKVCKDVFTVGGWSSAEPGRDPPVPVLRVQ